MGTSTSKSVVDEGTLTMKAMVQNGYGNPTDVLTLIDLPRPVVTPQTLLVKIHASSVNTPDWIMTLGKPYLLRLENPRPRNRSLGFDIAGVVEQIGEQVSGYKIGDRVVGCCKSKSGSSGAFAEYCIVAPEKICKIPDGVSYAEAAGSVMSGITALEVVATANLDTNSNVLINGASGGVGTFCVQMAKNKGAKVAGVCSHGNVNLVKSLGADSVVDYTKEDFTASEQRYDVIIDNVMNKPYAESNKVLTEGGFVIPNSVGVERGDWFGAIPYFFWKPSNYPTVDSTVTSEKMQTVMEMVKEKKIRVVIDKTYPLSECPDAVAYMASRRAKGQIIVDTTIV